MHFVAGFGEREPVMKRKRSLGGSSEPQALFIMIFSIFLLAPRPLPLRMGGAFADGFFGEQGLLADAVGNFGEFALIGANRGQIVNLPDEIERAKSFPDLLVARIDGGDFGAGG